MGVMRELFSESIALPRGGVMDIALPVIARKYRPDQAREPEGSPIGGRFADEGKGAAALDIVRQHDEAVTQLRAALPEHAFVAVGLHPNAIRAATEISSTFREMREAGYNCPYQVNVVAEDGANASHARVVGRTEMSIYVPASLPADISFDEATKAAWKAVGKEGYTTAASLRDVVIHEMGHLHNPDFYLHSTYSEAAFEQVARQVSPYATKNYHEFLAETFTRLYRGEKLPDNVVAFYTEVGGQMPLPRKQVG